jgi:putative membrane protein
MKKLIRWGLAAGLAAAVGLFFDAQAQSSTGGTGSSGSSGTAGSRGDTGGPPPSGKTDPSGSSQAGSSGSAAGSTSPQGGAAGTSSDPGSRSGTASGSTATGSSGQTGSTASGQASTGKTGGQGKVDKGLQERLEKLHAMNQAELQMAQLGSQNAQSPEVKQFAEQMQNDHQRADQKLTQTAQTAGAASLEGETFQKETDKHKKELDKLQSKTGADFDKAFMSRMVKDHESAVSEAEKAAKDAKKANQTELASFLEQSHSGMKGHLQHAKQLQKSIDQKGDQQRQGRRPPGATGGTGAGSDSGSGAAGSSGSGSMGSGSRGDTGGPSPTGKDSSSSEKQTTPQGGAAGTSSDSGQRK